MKKTIVNNWRYEDGWRDIPLVLQKTRGGKTKEFIAELVGWHCRVYVAENVDLDKWMEENMTGKYDCTLRFNSGDPMHTVFIEEDEDATLFKLTWM